MNGKPWADHRAPLDQRLAAAEIAIANVDTAAERRAIMRELVEGEMERVAQRFDYLIEEGYLEVVAVDRAAEIVRELKADAPAG